VLRLATGGCLLSSLLAACFSEDEPASDTDQTPCTPGEQRACDCEGGGTSVQVCREDGSGFGPCGCDGGTTDGSAGTTSSASLTSTVTSDTTDATGSVDDTVSSTTSGADESTQTTAAGPQAVYLYSTQTPFDGDLVGAAGQGGGRVAADILCASELDLACSDVHAALSVDAQDTLTTMPESFGLPVGVPVRGPTGIEIAASWLALVDANPVMSASLADAGVAVDSYWTGSDEVGGALDDCTGWSQNDLSLPGVVGSAAAIDSKDWMSYATASCGELRPLLCACW
jgi:hypothetical protein